MVGVLNMDIRASEVIMVLIQSVFVSAAGAYAADQSTGPFAAQIAVARLTW